MLKLNRSDQAKMCFLEALALDVKCYDSFEQLINGEMMSTDEGTLILLAGLSAINALYRMGLYPRAILRGPNPRRRRLHPTDIHIPITEIQAHRRTSFDP